MVVTHKVNKFGFLTEAFALWGEKGGFLGEGGGVRKKEISFVLFLYLKQSFPHRERERETFMSSFIFYCTYIAY